jgi:tetratricopeptide (TPR) repeat protein
VTLRGNRLDAALVVVAAAALRIAFAWETRDDPLFHALAIDARSYHDLGVSVASGDVLFGRDPLWFGPLYPLLVGGLFRVFGANPEPVILLQWGLGTVSAWLAWSLGRRFSRAAGLTSGLLVAVMPSLLVYEGQLLYTSLAVFLAAAHLVAFLGASDAGSPSRAAIAGAWLGALALVASSALLFVPVGAWRLGRRRGGRAATFFVLGVAAWLAPVFLRNGLVAGEWTAVPVNGGMLFATGFDRESVGGRAQLRLPTDFGPDGSYRRDAETAVGRRLSLAEASRWHRDQALARIAEDPAWAIGLVMKKVALLFTVREIDDNLGLGTFAERARTLRCLPAAWAWVLLPGLLGAALALRGRDDRAHDANSLGAFVLVFALSLLPFFVSARYRAPLVVPLAALAGHAVHAVPGALRRGNLARAAGSLVILVAATVAAFRDPGVREDRALQLNAVGAAILNEGRAAEALAILDRTVAADPGLAGAHANRSLALLALDREEEALAAARAATRLDPSLGSAWMTEGAILARGGRFDEALPAYRRAAELAPTNSRALSAYARCLAATGDLAGAIEAGRAAIERGDRALAPRVEEWRATLASGAETRTPRP